MSNVEFRVQGLGHTPPSRWACRRLDEISSGMHETQWNLEPKASKRVGFFWGVFRVQGLAF